ncbi:hypothetical protein D3C85_1126910 [compost metagenome]
MGGQCHGDSRQAGNGGHAHGEQHQAGIFILDLRHAFDLRRLGPQGQPEDQQDVDPDTAVPAGQELVHQALDRDQVPGKAAENGSGGKARVGSGQTGKGHGRSR